MKSCMPQSFSFGFGSDDIEFDVDETKDTLSLHTSHDERPITIIEPKLQKLEDMVRSSNLKSSSLLLPCTLFARQSNLMCKNGLSP